MLSPFMGLQLVTRVKAALVCHVLAAKPVDRIMQMTWPNYLAASLIEWILNYVYGGQLALGELF